MTARTWRTHPIWVLYGVVIAAAVVVGLVVFVPSMNARLVYLVEGCPGQWWGEQAAEAVESIAGNRAGGADECYGAQHVTALVQDPKASCEDVASRARSDGWRLRERNGGRLERPSGTCRFLGEKEVGGLRATLEVRDRNTLVGGVTQMYREVTVYVPKGSLWSRLRITAPEF